MLQLYTTAIQRAPVYVRVHSASSVLSFHIERVEFNLVQSKNLWWCINHVSWNVGSLFKLLGIAEIRVYWLLIDSPRLWKTLVKPGLELGIWNGGCQSLVNAQNLEGWNATLWSKIAKISECQTLLSENSTGVRHSSPVDLITCY